MPVRVLSHPLAAHLVTHLRDRTTKPATFRTLAYHLGLVLAIDATSRHRNRARRTIQTPLERMTSRVLARQPSSWSPILRAGLGMVQPFTDIFPM
jgi:uracil phosphoribosyltransferase